MKYVDIERVKTCYADKFITSEPEVVAANKKFGKICAQLCMQYAREILEEKSRPI